MTEGRKSTKSRTGAKDRKAKELVQDVRREPDAVTLVHELLTDAGESMDGLTADALGKKLDNIERIDRLISIAESRRNACLHEIGAAAGGPRRNAATERARNRERRI